ncbi:hypothetical protein B1T44_16795 [Mycobacterium persicum]|nr:hypothetical protein B1T44_16795 [Mycobacterium persicum]
MGVSKSFRELEEVPLMTMVGGFDVHRKQITFDYVDDDGVVHWGEIRPATRKMLRGWLGKHCPSGDAEFALEGCTGWRYVVEELAMAGVVAHLGDPAEIAGLRGTFEAAKCAAWPGSPDYGYYHQLATKHDGHNGKNPTLAVERKILRRCSHTLRELGDGALSPPQPVREAA